MNKTLQVNIKVKKNNPGDPNLLFYNIHQLDIQNQVLPC